MKPQTWLLLASIPLAGCNVATWGNLIVLCLTLVIFFGTLFMGQRPVAPGSDDNPGPGIVES